ncbi:TPA: sialidase family protein [Pseudomonas aeruginosa]
MAVTPELVYDGVGFVSNLVTDGNQRMLVLVGRTQFSLNVLYSNDAGVTWNSTGLPPAINPGDLAQINGSITDGHLTLTSSGFTPGGQYVSYLFCSDDAGMTWTEVAMPSGYKSFVTAGYDITMGYYWFVVEMQSSPWNRAIYRTQDLVDLELIQMLPGNQEGFTITTFYNNKEGALSWAGRNAWNSSNGGNLLTGGIVGSSILTHVEYPIVPATMYLYDSLVICKPAYPNDGQIYLGIDTSTYEIAVNAQQPNPAPAAYFDGEVGIVSASITNDGSNFFDSYFARIGGTWQQTSPLPTNQQPVAFVKGLDDLIYVLGNNGILSSTVIGATFTQEYTGFPSSGVLSPLMGKVQDGLCVLFDNGQIYRVPLLPPEPPVVGKFWTDIEYCEEF